MNGVLFIDGNRCRVAHIESKRTPVAVIPDDGFGHLGARYTCTLLLESDPPDPANRCAMEAVFCFHVPANDPNGPDIPDGCRPWQVRGSSMMDAEGREWEVLSSRVRPLKTEEAKHFDNMAQRPEAPGTGKSGTPFKVLEYHMDGVTVEWKGKPKRVTSKVFGAALAEICRTTVPRVKVPRGLERDNLKNNPFLAKYFKAVTDRGADYLAWK